MEDLRFKSICLTWVLIALFQLTVGQQCYICGPTEENRRCKPNKLMDVPSNITIDDTMCTVIENTAYHLDVLCTEYPGPQGYYFECVDKSNSQFSCRSTCGPSLNSIGTGPEFDLLNTGGGKGGNLLLGKKNKGSLFDFSDFRNGGALDFKFGGVQQGRYNPNNQAASNNANVSGSKANGTFGSASSSGNVNSGGFSSNTGNANIFDKNLFGNSGINNNVFNNKNGNINSNNGINSNSFSGPVNGGLNSNNQNVFQYQNPFSGNNGYNSGSSLSPSRPNSFRDPFGGSDKKPTPKLNTPKGNPFGNAPAFGQAPFDASSFGNPAPLTNGKTGLGFLEPTKLSLSGPPSKTKPSQFKKDQSGSIDFSGLGSSAPIDISKGAEQSSQSKSQSSSGNTRPESGKSFEGSGYPNGNVNSSPARPIVEAIDAASRGPSRNSDFGSNNDGVGGVGRQDPSSLTFKVKPVVTNYPTDEDSSFSPEQAKALYPIDVSNNGPTSNIKVDGGPYQKKNEAKFDARQDYEPPQDFNKNYVPQSYDSKDFNTRGDPQGNSNRQYDDTQTQPRPSVNPLPYDGIPKSPSGPSVRVANSAGSGPDSNAGRQIYSPEGSPPGLNSYPGAGEANAPPPLYSKNPSRTSTGPDSYKVNSGSNPNTYQSNNNYENPTNTYESNINYEDPKNTYQSNNNNGNPKNTYQRNNNFENPTNNYQNDNNYKNPTRYENTDEPYPSQTYQNTQGFGKAPNNKLDNGRSTSDDLRSNEVRDAIGPEGLKRKGLSPPDGLDGSRLRGNKENVGQGTGFVGTSLLADGDYLDRSNPGRAAKKQVPEEFEKPFEAQTSLFPGFDKFASGDSNSNFGTKDSVFNMFGDRSKSPPGFRDGNFNFNNPDFLRPHTYNNPKSNGQGKGTSGGNGGRPNEPSQIQTSQNNANNNYDPNSVPNANNNNYGGPYNADRSGNVRGGTLQNRFGQTPSSQPIFQAADRVLGKGNGDNSNNNGLARANPSYPPYVQPGSNNPYARDGQKPVQNSPYFVNAPPSRNTQGQTAPYGNIPINQNPRNPNVSPYPARANAQPALDPYGRAVGGSPYPNRSPQQQSPAYPPYTSPTRPGSNPNPYLGAQQPVSPPNRQNQASRYELPPASKLFYGNSPSPSNNLYAARQPNRVPPSGNQPSLYASYPGQDTRIPNSSPYNPNGYASASGPSQPFRGQGGPPSGFDNSPYQTRNGPGPNSNIYNQNNGASSSPSNTVVNFRPLNPSQGSDSQALQSNPYATDGTRQTSTFPQQQPGFNENSQPDIPSTVPAFTDIFGDLSSAANPPPQRQERQRRPTSPQAPGQSSSPFSFLTQELPNAAEKTAAFDLDNRKAFENRRQKFNTFDEGQPRSNNLRLPERRPDFIPGNPGRSQFPGGAIQQPGQYPGNPQRDQFTRGQGQGEVGNGLAPPPLSRFGGGGAGPDYQQPDLSDGGRGYGDSRGPNDYGAGQSGDPRLYGSFDNSASPRNGQATPLGRSQPTRQPGRFGTPGDRFENNEPTNQRFDTTTRDSGGRRPSQGSDPFSRPGGYGFEEDKFGNLDDDAFRNRFSNDRFADPTGYFGDSQFTDATTQEDSSQTSTQSGQGYGDDVNRPDQGETQYPPDY